MYCIKCGVKLEDTEKKCPLCGTQVVHPDFIRENAEPLFPPEQYPAPGSGARAARIVLTTICLLAVCLTLLCDYQINRCITWSGYVIGAVAIGYCALVLPYWFRRPNPVVFVLIVFAVTGVYLYYINHITQGDWFVSFAFPVAGCIGIIITAAVLLLRYVRRGKLYIFGGVFVALGLFVLLLEFLLTITFSGISFIGWSLYPMITLVMMGGMLIALGVSSTARDAVKRKTFI